MERRPLRARDHLSRSAGSCATTTEPIASILFKDVTGHLDRHRTICLFGISRNEMVLIEEASQSESWYDPGKKPKTPLLSYAGYR